MAVRGAFSFTMMFFVVICTWTTTFAFKHHLPTTTKLSNSICRICPYPQYRIYSPNHQQSRNNFVWSSNKWKLATSQPKTSSLQSHESSENLPNASISSVDLLTKKDLDNKNSMWRKVLALLLLTLQTSLLTLTMRWSHVRASSHAFGKGYIPSIAVVCSEIAKLSICAAMVLLNQRREKQSENQSASAQVPALSELIDLAIPSALYVIQNNLQYLSMRVLPAAVYQVLAQMKLLVTALILSLVYQQRLSQQKWTSISLLTAGVATVQVALTTTSGVTTAVKQPHYNLPLGVLAVTVSCLTSAYAGVRMEQTLKTKSKQSSSKLPLQPSSPSILSNKKQLQLNAMQASAFWKTNLMYAGVSLTMSCIYALIKDIAPLWYKTQSVLGLASSPIAQIGSLLSYLFQGFSPLVWLVVALQAVGGILVALVVTQTNSIVKSFATSTAIVLTALLSAGYLKDPSLQHVYNSVTSPASIMFWVGTAMVSLATILYALPNKTSNPPRQPH